jgi:hypothetical protein
MLEVGFELRARLVTFEELVSRSSDRHDRMVRALRCLCN